MQFARFVPTMFHDRFAKADVDIYGKKHIGSLRAVYDVIAKVTSGEVQAKDMKAYIESLDPVTRKRFNSGLRGFGMTTLALFVGETFNLNTANEVAGDANYYVNKEKLEFKMMPSMIRSLHNILSSFWPGN